MNTYPFFDRIDRNIIIKNELLTKIIEEYISKDKTDDNYESIFLNTLTKYIN